MKNYDQNQDGYISLQDFEEIAANFPFSFCIRKTDRWGSRSVKKKAPEWGTEQWKRKACSLQQASAD